ncbi:hypothetical protein AKJ63_01910 [candidate division MSBL1 archaeon SCGC-AAA259D18]|uniref:Glycosyl hydrolase family 32 N-terminal domain-containing protein n=1 Tax=candidate division MSBL1 archaeon SCGC-AAA259D18 TaxID=1698262 RepID=A0A133UA79_9EURY|nr:hypothetical protein AKJ63_01910 [candidate division MSBL1 archaeon SCGC-AAA259D18]
MKDYNSKILANKHFLNPIIPNLSEYVTIAAPEKGGTGNWVGAPSVIMNDSNEYWLAYRLRNRKERGYEIRICKSKDGEIFNTEKRIEKRILMLNLWKDPRSSKTPELAITSSTFPPICPDWDGIF